MTASAAVLSLSAKGQQDAVINAEPTHTIWRSVHIRYTSSASDDDLSELTTSGFDTSSTMTVNRYGDLISRIALEVQLPPLAAPQIPVTPATNPVTYIDAADTGAHYVNCIGYALFDTLKVDVGGSTVEELYSDFCFLYEELAGRPGLRLEEQIGRVTYSSECDEDLIAKASVQQTLYVPLPLWISKFQPATYGLALPIIALTGHDVRIKIQTRPINQCTAVVYKQSGVWQLSDAAPLNANTGAPLVNTDLKMRVMVTSIFLEDVERNAILAVDHSFLINVAKQSTLSIAAGQATKVENKLYLSHPSSSLLWFARPLDWATAGGRRRYSVGFKDRFDFTSQVSNSVTSLLPYGDSTEPVTLAGLTLNNNQRFAQDMPGVYFRTSQPYTNFRTMPTTPIYAYGIALQAHQWQPTQTINFSSLENVSLGLTYTAGVKASELIVFNECYNLFLITGGQGGLQWSS